MSEYETWAPWFAWHPVNVGGQWVWLKSVSRRPTMGRGEAGQGDGWEYRPLDDTAQPPVPAFDPDDIPFAGPTPFQMAYDDPPLCPNCDQLAAECEGRIATLEAENAALRGSLQNALDALSEAEELNPSNYDHDLVCSLNASWCEAHDILRAALSRPGGATLLAAKALADAVPRNFAGYRRSCPICGEYPREHEGALVPDCRGDCELALYREAKAKEGATDGS